MGLSTTGYPDSPKDTRLRHKLLLRGRHRLATLLAIVSTVLLTGCSATGVLNTLTPGGSLTQRTFWETPWGRRERFYVDAIADDRRVIAVFTDSDLWDCEKLHIEPPRAYADRPLRDVTCCGVTRQVRGYPCATCDSGYCPACGNCRCQKNAAREQQCQGCYQVFLPHLLIDRRCEECR